MKYSGNKVKELLTLENVLDLLEYLDAEPQLIGDTIISKTICHDGHSHKLYYYEEQQLFHCYTGDCGSFDIFELLQKNESVDNFDAAISFVVNYLNLQNLIETDNFIETEDWKIFKRYNKIAELEQPNRDKILLNEIDKQVLSYLPQPEIIDWTKNHINKEICDYYNIRYDPQQGSIIIPHTDIDNRLIGIRMRTLIKDQEKYGKYRPWKNKGKLYNHPLAFNLYGLAEAAPQIQKMKTVIVAEAEKSVLAAASYLGIANNICVAVCGSSISQYQFNLLLDLGIQEMVVAFDRDYKEIGDEDFKSVVKKLKKIYEKYSPHVNVSFLFDKENILDYKSSPLDHGKDAFLYLFRNRVVL